MGWLQVSFPAGEVSSNYGELYRLWHYHLSVYRISIIVWKLARAGIDSDWKG